MNHAFNFPNASGPPQKGTSVPVDHRTIAQLHILQSGGTAVVTHFLLSFHNASKLPQPFSPFFLSLIHLHLLQIKPNLQSSPTSINTVVVVVVLEIPINHQRVSSINPSIHHDGAAASLRRLPWCQRGNQHQLQLSRWKQSCHARHSFGHKFLDASIPFCCYFEPPLYFIGPHTDNCDKIVSRAVRFSSAYCTAMLASASLMALRV